LTSRQNFAGSTRARFLIGGETFLNHFLNICVNFGVLNIWAAFYTQEIAACRLSLGLNHFICAHPRSAALGVI